MTQLELLQQKLKDLLQLRSETEISDDFAYTNGKIQAINRKINYIDQQIKEILNEKS